MAHQGPIGADAVQARCLQQHTHEPKLLEPPWFTKALLSPKLMEAFSPTKASLVLTVCEKGAPSSTSMILDQSMHLDIPKALCVEAVRGMWP